MVVVERRPDQELPGSRSGGLQARTIEMFDQRGVADRFLSAGHIAQVNMFAGTLVDISHSPTRHPYGLALWQGPFEAILAGWVHELGVTVLYGRELAGFAQDEHGVTVGLSDGTSLGAQYLVGCDGGRSSVRRGTGIPFTGTDPTVSSLIAEVRASEPLTPGITRDRRGQHGIGPTDHPDYHRVVVREPELGRGAEPTLDALSDAMAAVWGTDFGIHDPCWISRFTDATRQAESYRDRRVLLAGDAAHVHSPVGGQGLNTGVQDAMNLGWKLAQVVHGSSPERLLDSYGDERHPIAARVLRHTLSQTALMPSDAPTDALRATLGELVGLDEVRRSLGGELSGLALQVEIGAGNPLIGRRIPDLEVVAAAGPIRLYSLLRCARPVLLGLGDPVMLPELPAWAAHVQVVSAGYDGPGDLPVLGPVDAPPAVLIRPDGYVAWAGDPSDPALRSALGRWFGPAGSA